MTALRLGVNNCFAVKRWPRPQDWAPLVRDELGVTFVQHSLDFVDVADTEAALAHAAALRRACDGSGLELHSTFTGLAAYSSNLLMHPDAAERDRAERWYRAAIDFTSAAGASATGGHVGAMSVADWRDPQRRADMWDALRASLERLSAYARARGLDTLYVENLAAAREPSTMSGVRSLLRTADEDHAAVALCLDVGHQCVPGTTGADRDPYAWLRQLAPAAPVVQLQQSDAEADHHWPFTAATNALGRIEPRAVLDAIEQSGAAAVDLVLEVIPPFEQDDDEVLAGMVASVAHWRAALSP